ncbi:hypothetical protein COA01_34935 [Bacillus cereus]|uniref:hypothetical protein n=1 Tax=Bacillus cereus TaxID=1396 RepID=UPI000BFC1F71|nr:hypothetical protein [Bacillus cereus]PGP12018.1 hypothetical protein COA01_34935 [Bacillus cereus]
MSKVMLQEVELGIPTFNGKNELVILNVTGVCSKTSPLRFEGIITNDGKGQWNLKVNKALYKSGRNGDNAIEKMLGDLKTLILQSNEFKSQEDSIQSFINDYKMKKPLPDIELVSQEFDNGNASFIFTTEEIEKDRNNRDIQHDPVHYDLYGYMPGAEGMMERGIINFRLEDDAWKVQEYQGVKSFYYDYSTYFGFKEDMEKHLYETLKLALLMHLV